MESVARVQILYKAFHFVLMHLGKGGIHLFSNFDLIRTVKYTGAEKSETLTTLRCSGTKRLLISWL